ncbi:hypothetical protein CLU79DRAFT_832492 [Phycomyces nitens]|nr:hypothetical protein CLU79DRAFT_832492 [Phycomyces nitens]
MDVTDEDIYALQKMFPNIKYINLDDIYISQKNFGLAADWHPWRLLRELAISLWRIDTPDMGNKLVKLLLTLPVLRRLEIKNHNILISSLSFSLNDLETIHLNLKHLGHLSLKSKLLPISDIALAQIADVLPATTMRKLRIESENTDHRWLYYFAHKYPNLRTIEFHGSNTLTNPEEQRNSTIPMLLKDSFVFQYLTELYIRYPDFTGEEDILFWDIPNFENIPLKRATIYIRPMDPHSPDNHCDFCKRITESYLTKFSKTIELFNLCCESIHTVPVQLVKMENTLYNLVKLYTNIPISADIDSLLCAAPRLKTIVLFDADIKVRDELYTPKRFDLQSFTLYSGNITSDVLRFLSFHCRSLDVLELKKLSIYGNFTTPGCQFIDMTYTRLKKLDISYTEFIIQDNTECPDNINIMLITRPVEDIPPKQEYDPNVLPTVIGTPTKAHYDWFYASEPKMMHPISKERGSRIIKFFSNYEENKRITLEKAPIKMRKHCNRWKRRCAFGYTNIGLGYVADYEVDRTWPERHLIHESPFLNLFKINSSSFV